MLSFDAVTRAEIEAAVTADLKAQAVLAAFAAPVSVTVYNGSAQVMGSGVMNNPWAVRSQNVVTVAEVASFSVGTTGTPGDGWYLRFESGSRWLRGDFGPNGDFTWSLPTWEAGQTGSIGTITIRTYKITAESQLVATFNVAGATITFGWTIPEAPAQALGNVARGGTVNLAQYAVTTGGTPAYSIAAGSPAGFTVGESTGVLSVGSAVPTGAYTVNVDLVNAAATGVFEPAITDEPAGEQYVVFDDGVYSPDYRDFDSRLNLRWANVNVGDWVDADGTPQGSAYFTRTAIPTDFTFYDFDVATLVQRALTTGNNKGFFLRASGSGPTIPIAGRLNATEANRPTLTVVTNAGTFNCPCLATAVWGRPPGTELPSDGRSVCQISATRNGIIRFDLSGVTGTVSSATMRLYVGDRFGTSVYLNIYEANPPTFQMGAGAADQVVASTDGKTGVPVGAIATGLAAQVGEAALAAHANVIAAGHFEGTTYNSSTGRWTVPSFGITRASGNVGTEIIPDTDAPGTYCWRGYVPSQVIAGSEAGRNAIEVVKNLMLPDYTDATRPVDMTTHADELYVRCYFMYETSFVDQREGVKMGLALDARLGYWVTNAGFPNGGYWQNDGGSSNSYGDGMAHLGDCHDNDGSIYSSSYYTHVDRSQWTYKGNMCWNQGGYTGTPGTPNWDIRPIRRYDYSIDMPNGVYTDGQSPLNNIVHANVRLGRWYCLERYMKLNTLDLSQPILGLKDGSFYNNYEANADGIMRTWLNGVLIDERTDYRWRRHAHIGIRGAGVQWYIGGQGTNSWPAPMRFRVNHLVIARQYIGPRVRP